MDIIKEYTERLLKSVVIYGVVLVCVCSLINCVACNHDQVDSGVSVCTDTDSIVKQIQPDSMALPIDPVEDSCFE